VGKGAGLSSNLFCKIQICATDICTSPDILGGTVICPACLDLEQEF